MKKKTGAIRLVCLEAKDNNDNAAGPKVVWTQSLAHTKDKIAQDMNRRIHAAHVSYSKGFLVCPTNAGAMVAVDLLTHSLVWAHYYREQAPPPPVQPGRHRIILPRTTA